MVKNTDQLKIIEKEGFIYICEIDELKEYIGKRFIINDVELALFKINSIVYALSNICPHQQTHLIYEGFIEDEYVICPAHGWKFNLKTGKKPSGSNGLITYPVKIINNRVFVKVHPRKQGW